MKKVSRIIRETEKDERAQGVFYSKYEMWITDRTHHPLLLSDNHYRDRKCLNGGLEPVMRGRESDLKVRHSFPMLKFLFWEDNAPVFPMGDEQLKFHPSGEVISDERQGHSRR